MPSHRHAQLLAASLIVAMSSVYANSHSDSSEVSGSQAARARRSAALGSARRLVTVQWADVPLRASCDRLAKIAGIDIFLDRRLDPGSPVSIIATDATQLDVLARVASKMECGVTTLGGVFYVGPHDIVDELNTIAALRREDTGHAKVAHRASSAELTWPRLSEPRTIVAQILAETGFRIKNPERIEFDLWDAGTLPNMRLADALTILLAGFDLTYRISSNDNSIELYQIPDTPTLRRVYRLDEVAPLALRRIGQKLPDSQYNITGSRLTLKGRWEEHQLLEETLANFKSGGRRSPRKVQQKRHQYSLRVVEQRLGKIIEQLQERIHLEFKFALTEPAKKKALQQLVSFEVESVELDELLEEMLKSAGLTHRRRGKTVVVSASD